MDRSGLVHWKAMERVIGFLSSNSDRVLKLRKPSTLTVEAFVDSDYATNKDTRRSVTGYLVTIGGALVSWQSKSQSKVALSSTEAEYVAMSNCATEVKYVTMLLHELVGTVPTPGILHEDITGAIFMVHNSQVGARTKHIDIRYHHVKEMVEEKSLIVQYIKSEKNPADLMTKNVKEATHNMHSPNIFNGLLTSINMGSGMLAQGGCQEIMTSQVLSSMNMRHGLRSADTSCPDTRWTGDTSTSTATSVRKGTDTTKHASTVLPVLSVDVGWSCPTTNRKISTYGTVGSYSQSPGGTTVQTRVLNMLADLNKKGSITPEKGNKIVNVNKKNSHGTRVFNATDTREQSIDQRRFNDLSIGFDNNNKVDNSDWITVTSKRKNKYSKKSGHG
jgi:hypothetical protein